MDTKRLNSEYKIAKQKSSKPMLWVGMLSIAMFFAGLTSAYIISAKREDWVDFILPNSLVISTIIIILSSLTFILSRKMLQSSKMKASFGLLVLTFVLGVLFVYFQYQGLLELGQSGLSPAGKGSLISSSLLVAISFAHILHLLAGIIVLKVVIYNHFKERYNSTDLLGFELGEIYWHFIGLIWVGLFLFFYFY